jgi:hypothetical protein
MIKKEFPRKNILAKKNTSHRDSSSTVSGTTPIFFQLGSWNAALDVHILISSGAPSKSARLAVESAGKK